MTACNKCGAPDGGEVVIEKDGVEMGRGCLCDPCLDAAHALAATNREIFDELIASGVSRERANELMIARLDGKGATT